MLIQTLQRRRVDSHNISNRKVYSPHIRSFPSYEESLTYLLDSHQYAPPPPSGGPPAQQQAYFPPPPPSNEFYPPPQQSNTYTPPPQFQQSNTYTPPPQFQQGTYSPPPADVKTQLPIHTPPPARDFPQHAPPQQSAPPGPHGLAGPVPASSPSNMPGGAPGAAHFVGAGSTSDDVGTFNGGSYRISHRDTNTILTVQLAMGAPLIAKPGMSYFLIQLD
jgi:hypothetical protein